MRISNNKRDIKEKPGMPGCRVLPCLWQGRKYTIYHLKGGVVVIYVCDACGWEYDEEQGSPENGIAPGTKFEDLPDDFECPLCGASKEIFSET
jgi:rubredoxin-NAD+ reductase